MAEVIPVWKKKSGKQNHCLKKLKNRDIVMKISMLLIPKQYITM